MLYVTYRHLVSQGEEADIYALFLQGMSVPQWWIIIVVVLLMPFNWILESFKWQKAIQPFIKLDLTTCVKAILQGVSFGIITPHRIGEYGGRILVLKPENNWKGIAATLVCSLAQNVVNVSLGLVALSLYLAQHNDLLHVQWIVGGSIMVLIILVVCFLYFQRLSVMISKWVTWDKAQKYMKKIELLEGLTITTLTGVLLLSVFRYLIYFLQYYLLLLFFGFDIAIMAGFAGIGLIYLIQTGLPLPSILSVAARGEIALLVWGTTYGMGIIAATFSLWIINLLIPAIIGLFFVFNTNVIRSLGYEK